MLFYVGKDIGGTAVGLLAALFLALDPSVIQRSNLGWYETEAVGLLGLLLFIWAFLRANDTTRSLGSCVKYSLAAGLALAFFIGGWGSAYYIIGLMAVFGFVLLLMRRNSHHLLFSFSVSLGLGLFLSINMTYFTPIYLFTYPVLAVTAVFVLLCMTELWHGIDTARGKAILSIFVLAALAGTFALLYDIGKITSIASKFYSTLNPFYRASTPILASVAEHAITPWGSIYVEFGISILFFMMGLYFTMKNLTTKNVFLILFGITALYFSASMVRLLVILAPAFGIIAAIGIMGLLKPFYTLMGEASKTSSRAKTRLRRVGREFSAIVIVLIFIVLVTNLAFSPQTGGTPRVYGSAFVPLTITASSLPIATSVPQWSEMLTYMRDNLQSTTVVSAWWDYGEWLSVLGNVTSLTDNTTENSTQIENQAYSFMANETQSLKMLANYNVSYVLVFVTLELEVSSGSLNGVQFAGYGDDGKWVQMARISGEAQARFMGDETYGTSWMDSQYSWTNENDFGNYTTSSSTGQQTWTYNDAGLNTTIFKLMSNAEQSWGTANDVSVTDQTAEAPTYFSTAFIAGMDLSATTAYDLYGGLVPLVALYKINWSAYDAATNSTAGP